MYPLIFAGKPLFLQVLCDADCFHISVVWRYCCSGLPVWADGGRTGLLEVSPVAILLSENGAAPEENVSISPDDTYTGAAPLEFRFMWRDEDSGEPSDETANFRYEWNFSRDAAFNDIFLNALL